MSSTLLEKTRRLNRIIQSSGSDPVRFSDLAEVLSEILNSNVFIVSRRGRILGYKLIEGKSLQDWGISVTDDLRFSNTSNRQLLQIVETESNIVVDNSNFITGKPQEDKSGKFTTIVPISCGGDRLGTLIVERWAQKFTDDDLVLAEYSATIAGMEIMHAKAEEAEREAREKAVVQMAVDTLSFSELEAVEHIFNELDGTEGLLVASKIADRVGITRSVIVNALRKLESAGVIESRSLGMKGTFIKILNDKLLDELEKLKED